MGVPPPDAAETKRGPTPREFSMTTIDKVAWIHVEAGRVLCTRSRGKDAFYLPGGKREPGESDEDCLRREVAEELGVALQPDTLRALDVIEAAAHGRAAGTRVRTACYAAQYVGQLEARAEIEEFAWLCHADRGRGSETLRLVLDALRARGDIV